MTTLTQEEISAIIEANKEAGTKIVRAHLQIAGLADKEISAAIKEAGLGRNSAGWTQTNTLAFLEEGKSEFQLFEKIIEEEAKNEARWIGDRNRIRKTLNKIFEKFEAAIAEEAATEAQKEAIKTLLGK